VAPLDRATDWVHVTLDVGDGPRRYRRETSTMPQWAGSSWYYLWYLRDVADPAGGFPTRDALARWTAPTDAKPLGGVDLYVGGAEHAVRHLLYARFWHKVLFDLGHVPSSEPFARLVNQGYVQAWAHRDARGVPVAPADVVEADGYT
jgi:leucyl-tRNA synthetase